LIKYVKETGEHFFITGICELFVDIIAAGSGSEISFSNEAGSMLVISVRIPADLDTDLDPDPKHWF